MDKICSDVAWVVYESHENVTNLISFLRSYGCNDESVYPAATQTTAAPVKWWSTSAHFWCCSRLAARPWPAAPRGLTPEHARSSHVLVLGSATGQCAGAIQSPRSPYLRGGGMKIRLCHSGRICSGNRHTVERCGAAMLGSIV